MYLFFTSVNISEAQTGALTIKAPFAYTSPVCDGFISPGEYGLGLFVDMSDNVNPGLFWKFTNRTTATHSDLSYTIYSAHTLSTLFIAFAVSDQFIDDQIADANLPFRNDSVELFLDADRVSNDLNPLQTNFAPGTKEGFQIISDVLGNKYSAASDFTNADWTVATQRTADGYVIEFAIPLNLLDTLDGPGFIPATTGSIIRFNAVVNDNDSFVSAQTGVSILWRPADGESPYREGEPGWAVDLALTPTPALTLLTVSPNVLTGGNSATGTVTLSSPPESDTFVSLTSSDTALTVPANVLVLAGNTTATFGIGTALVLNDTPVTVTASLNNITKQAAVLVTPDKLVSVKAPVSVIGGKNAVGTVALSIVASTGGFTVNLSSANNSIASVPSTVTVPAGAKTVTFPIGTTPVVTSSPILITAAFGGSSKSTTLTVQRPGLLSNTLKTSSVIGGVSGLGTVKLNGIAPAGGVVVALNSSAPSVANVPFSVTVPAGTLSVSYPVTTVPVGANLTIGLHAILNSVDKAANLTVKAPVISSLKLLPAIVKGGVQNSTGTVTLTGIAPVGDMVVTLSSSDVTAATVPASVTVSAGTKIATFPIISQSVVIQKKTTISAVTGLISKLATLTVNP